MARFDVYPMPRGTGFVVDIQANFLSTLKTRAVVPLVPENAAVPRMKELNPVFEIGGITHVMQTQAIAAIPVGELRRVTTSLENHHDEIVKALDMLFTGY